MTNFAAFVLSSGRCGTQWLEQNLGDAFPDVAQVAHEPLYMDYFPRRLFGLGRPDPAGETRTVIAHGDRIEGILRWSHFIECGWPAYAAIQYYAERFRDRIRVVHLVRHPVPTASSMVTHGYYSVPSGHHVTDRALLTPWDEGTLFHEYRARWANLSAFEKCLYFWAELQARALRIEGELGIPWLRIRYEDLFEGDALDRLLDFLELPRRPAIYEALKQPKDGYRMVSRQGWDPRSVADHPRVIELAKRLGYDALAVDAERIRRRYLAGAGQE